MEETISKQEDHNFKLGFTFFFLCPFLCTQAYEKCFQNLHYMERYEEHTIAHAIQAQYEKTKVYLPVILFICYISCLFFFVCAVVIYCLYINEITDKMEIPNVLTMPPHPPKILLLLMSAFLTLKSQIYLWPGPLRSGMAAGRTVETVLYLAGFSNVKSKVFFYSLSSIVYISAFMLSLNFIK